MLAVRLRFVFGRAFAHAHAEPVEDGSEPPPSPVDEAAAGDEEERDASVERQLRAREDAATAGDRAGVARAERELDRLADQAPPDESGKAKPQDPYDRMIAAFRFKQAPLYVQQIESSSSDHRLFVRLNEDAFCLLTADARQAAAAAVYDPADRQLRSEGVDDFEFILVPLRLEDAEAKDALAIGRRGRMQLTRAGRAC